MPVKELYQNTYMIFLGTDYMDFFILSSCNPCQKNK